MTPPRVSVLMSVYNAGSRLHASVASILRQSYTDLELVVIDDGSTDQSADVLRGFDDPRLRVVRQPNRGLTASLNVALSHARGELLARQDAGDASLPDRIARQVECLDRNARLGLVSTWAMLCLPDGRPFLTEQRPTTNEDIQRQLLHENCVFGAAAMFRRSAIDRVGGYCEAFRYAQDYDLHLRIAEASGVENIPQVLYACEAPLNGGISLSRVAEQQVYAGVACELARRRRDGKPIPDENGIAALCRKRVDRLRETDRRRWQVRCLDRWARNMWARGLRGPAAGLFARCLRIGAAHPSVWPQTAGVLGGFAWWLARRRLRSWSL